MFFYLKNKKKSYFFPGSQKTPQKHPKKTSKVELKIHHFLNKKGP